MTFAKRQQRRQAERPVTDPYKLWAAWFLGATSHHHPGRVRPPLHPDLSNEFYSGASVALAGFLVIPDLDEALRLVRFVDAGNPPHAYGGAR